MQISEPNKKRFAAFSMAAACLISLPCFAQGTPPATPPPARSEPQPYTGNRPQSIKDGVQIQTAYREDMIAMEDAIPTKALAKPKQSRKILVLCKATGYVHSSIPLAAETVKAMGEKTGAYTATISYDSADINSGEPRAIRRDLPR